VSSTFLDFGYETENNMNKASAFMDFNVLERKVNQKGKQTNEVNFRISG
jgi:hypothetical protein